MTDPKRLTAKQAAEILEVSPRTLRRWAKAFKDQLSEGARGRRRSYNGRDIETLRLARELFEQGLASEQIVKQLPIRGKAEETTAVVLSTEQAMIVGELREVARRFGLDLSDHDTRIERTEEELRRFRIWLRLPWWKRLFDRPYED